MSIDSLTLYKLTVFITVIYVSWISYYYPIQYKNIQEQIKNNQLN